MTRLFNISKIISICLLFFTGINAIIAGILFIVDPSGNKMGMSTSYLSTSPFSNFLIPGITLFIVNGLMNIVAAVWSIKNYAAFPILIILQGILLSGWIIIQVIFVRDFNCLHLLMLSIGILITAFGIIINDELNHFKHL